MGYFSFSRLVFKIFFMTPYISLFILSCLSTFMFDTNSKYKNIFFLMLFSVIFFFCAFRYNVGGDWKRYLYLYHNNPFTLNDIFFKKESLFYLINSFSNYISKNIFFSNLIFSIIFFLSIFPFLISKKNPALSLIIFLPLGIFILHMGFIRQSLALSLIILSIYFYKEKSFYTSFFFIIVSIGFHFSAILFISVILFHYINFKIKRDYIYALTIITALLIIIFTILKYYYKINLDLESLVNDNIYSFKLIQSYIIHNQSISPGLFYRIIPSLISFFIMLFFFNNENENDYWLLFFFLLMIFIFLSISLGFFTLADRLNYYTLPFQIIIFLFIIEKIKNIYFKNLYILFLQSLYLSILLVWLLFSKFSQNNWQNYTTIF